MPDNGGLERLGWDHGFRLTFEQLGIEDTLPGRIAVEHRGTYVAYTAGGELRAEPSGRLRHDARGRGDLPAAGDWVALRPRPGEAAATVVAVLPRRSAFSRKVAGFTTDEQVLAANIDQLWLCVSLTRELSARRLERYLAAAWESGAQPVIVLTKADLDEADAARVGEIEAVALGAPMVSTSAVSGQGVDDLASLLQPNRTAALLGSSGVGKSTLVNVLVGEERQATLDTRRDDVGRHTTTRRELILVPGGGLLLDTPGLREVVLWDDDGVDGAFGDVTAHMTGCRFADCRHDREPGCAVRAALASGELDPERLEAYRKLQREAAYLEQRKDGRARMDTKRRWKQITKAHRQRARLKGR